tara:strand:+ start:1289 stop:1933 length:645 start_codon:yes stop_codon:yes gene_type:complete
MIKPIVIVMAKWHGYGRSKSRLARDSGKKIASAIQSRMTNHTFHVIRSLERNNVINSLISISGLGSKAAKRWGEYFGFKNISVQGEGSLGLRMKRQLLLAYRGSKQKNIYANTKIIFIGTDLPNLNQNEIKLAINKLSCHDLTIGPSNDGGYWLIGLNINLINYKINWPFEGIPWGTSKVTETTLKKAQLNSQRIYKLHYKNDIDDINDLNKWL